jgi:hypothetical protein
MHGQPMHAPTTQDSGPARSFPAARKMTVTWDHDHVGVRGRFRDVAGSIGRDEAIRPTPTTTDLNPT